MLRDIRAVCSKETERIGNTISERGVLPCSEVTKRGGEKSSLFWCTKSNPNIVERDRGGA